ncbi:fasciclin domain-containing protein [Porphyrobacter algicida]|uniref:Fasciclin domain-containing protein n=1 Tax=Qipengyuania algicida TaxID=1836209 RepID=A0A845AJZ9_9SPHN|nr:fasciclin domain-containing protein [Qipengyuania algicida]MXP29944.1 fasciclin domain-containing protein [Qipengyuania algicida]
MSIKAKHFTLTLASAAGLALASLGGVGLSGAAIAGANVPMVGGAPMYPSKNIVQNAVNSKEHTTLVAAVKAAGLVQTLESPGPFTVFAPTNAAFDKLPAGTVQALLKPENKAKLVKILTYHVVPGRLTAADIMAKIKAGHGKAMLKTVEGEDLTAEMKGGKLVLIDAKGGMATVTQANVMQSNGVIHVTNAVSLP